MVAFQAITEPVGVIAGPSQPAEPPRPTETVSVAVNNATLGLTVTVDGRPAALPVRLPRDGRPHQLEFRSAKFRTERRTVRGDADRTLHLDNIPNFEP